VEIYSHGFSLIPEKVGSIITRTRSLRWGNEGDLQVAGEKATGSSNEEKELRLRGPRGSCGVELWI
jgi:hypothetical protein